MIHVVGVDGVGKSSLLNCFEKGVLGGPLRVLRCPQFHQSSQALQLLEPRLLQLSNVFEEIGNAADHARRPDIKAWALFYAMSLYAQIIRYKAEGFTFAERYPAFELAVYSPIYVALLRGIRPEKIDFLEKHPSFQSLILPYLQEVTGQRDFLFSFQFIEQELGKKVSARRDELFPIFPESKIVFLKAQIATVLWRLQQKSKDKRAEFHEQARYLEQIQEGYEKLFSKIPAEQTCVLQTDEFSPEQLSQILCQQLQKWQ